jgi:hypothetical protein
MPRLTQTLERHIGQIELADIPSKRFLDEPPIPCETDDGPQRGGEALVARHHGADQILAVHEACENHRGWKQGQVGIRGARFQRSVTRLWPTPWKTYKEFFISLQSEVEE